ncbi:hypothetical protein GCM10010123_45960 [Pilimelia anulata]|uniref:Uncharacterized protein n=1 Tax=Pilimelia anulata TaxID=53371 RepID=A0A8J3BD36_9ACTN|nr:hypothetical protein [Pilimelia anulata]GGK10811.1 hypothetical protein GCM10010123_45960 [Pilimelia anulata]
MNLKRDQPIPPPPAEGEWLIICGTREARTGWPDLQRQAGANLARAHETLRTDPAPVPETDRQHRLRGKQLRSGEYQGRTLPRWQYEVTGGGRIWYLVDAEHRQVIVVLASTGHPKATE